MNTVYIELHHSIEIMMETQDRCKIAHLVVSTAKVEGIKAKRSSHQRSLGRGMPKRVNLQRWPSLSFLQEAPELLRASLIEPEMA